MSLETTETKQAILFEDGKVNLSTYKSRSIVDDDTGEIEELGKKLHRAVLDPRSKDYQDKVNDAFVNGDAPDSEVVKFVKEMLISIESNRNKQLQSDLDEANSKISELQVTP